MVTPQPPSGMFCSFDTSFRCGQFGSITHKFTPRHFGDRGFVVKGPAVNRIGQLIATLFGPLADRIADRIADRLEAKLPDLSDLDDQIVAKLPDLSNLPKQIGEVLTSVVGGLPGIPVLRDILGKGHL